MRWNCIHEEDRAGLLGSKASDQHFLRVNEKGVSFSGGEQFSMRGTMGKSSFGTLDNQISKHTISDKALTIKICSQAQQLGDV